MGVSARNASIAGEPMPVHPRMGARNGLSRRAENPDFGLDLTLRA